MYKQHKITLLPAMDTQEISKGKPGVSIRDFDTWGSRESSGSDKEYIKGILYRQQKTTPLPTLDIQEISNGKPGVSIRDFDTWGARETSGSVDVFGNVKIVSYWISRQAKTA